MTIYSEVPNGWRVLHGATNHPPGCRWIDNNKSRWNKDRQTALVKEEGAYEWDKANRR
jgi:uncharacterized protein YbdZ (MbtH family)